MARIKWGAQKKRSKSRTVGSRQPKPGVGFLAKNVPIFLVSFLLFCFSKEIFSFDEELIIIACLFIVFLTLVEGLKNQLDLAFTQTMESVLDFYLERFLFTKWGLLEMKRSVVFLIFNHIQTLFLIFYMGECYFYLWVTNIYLKKLYFKLYVKELLHLILLNELLSEKSVQFHLFNKSLKKLNIN